jgi:hypothetical protein
MNPIAKLLCLAAPLALCVLAARAQMPPSGAPGQPGQPGMPAPVAADIAPADLAAFLKGYIEDRADHGVFRIYDARSKKQLSLKLVKVGEDQESRKTGPETILADAVFEDDSGERYEVDFQVRAFSKEMMSVEGDRTAVRKVGKKARYKWVFDETRQVWKVEAKAPAAKKSAPEKPAGEKPPETEPPAAAE